MKQIIFAFFFFLSFTLAGQSDCITETVDKFTDNVTYSINADLLKGHVAQLVDLAGENYLYPFVFKNSTGLALGISGYANCIDDEDKVYLIFDNGEKLVLTNQVRYNCKGTWAYWPGKKSKLTTLMTEALITDMKLKDTTFELPEAIARDVQCAWKALLKL